MWENVPPVQCAGKHATGAKHATDFKRGKKKATTVKSGKKCDPCKARENVPPVQYAGKHASVKKYITGAKPRIRCSQCLACDKM